MTIEQTWDILEEHGVSEQTLQTVTAINGYTLDTLNDIIYAVFGLRNAKQLLEEYK